MTERVPISDAVPISKACHSAAGVSIPPPRSPEGPLTFDTFYASLCVSTLPTACDGVCGLDCMSMMLEIPQRRDT